ncbi:hypothetical protein BDV32DRAFT_123530, partial [Aspergillus pseudonomiae]
MDPLFFPWSPSTKVRIMFSTVPVLDHAIHAKSSYTSKAVDTMRIRQGSRIGDGIQPLAPR